MVLLNDVAVVAVVRREEVLVDYGRREFVVGEDGCVVAGVAAVAVDVGREASGSG